MVRAESTDARPVSSDEYDSITKHAALVDRPDVGRLKVSGADALDLLNRLSTNNLEHFTLDKSMGTVLTTNKGRIIDLLTIIPTGDYLLVLTSPGRQQQVADWIGFYTFGEDVTVEDITDETAMLAIVGPESFEAIQNVLGFDVEKTEPLSLVESESLDGATLVRTDYFNLPTFELIGDPKAIADAIASFDERDIKPVSQATAENLRISNSVPSATGELTEDFNPLEAGLRSHISFNKICYIGQEVVARLDAYEKVQRHLVTFEWDSEQGVPIAGTALTVDGKNAGQLTSVGTREDAKGIALGYVRKAHVVSGTSVVAESSDGTVTLTVAALSGEV
jgi:folate-binding protein YgfZ